MTTVHITGGLLAHHHACNDSLLLFEKYFPNGYRGPYGPIQQAALLMGPFRWHMFWLWRRNLVPRYSMAGWSMHSADLSLADLRGGADLRGVKAHHARLVGVQLDNARLNGACLRGADLSGASLHGATLINADLRGADLSGGSLCYATLTGADLREADLGHTDIRWANLKHARLEGALFISAPRLGVILDDSGAIRDRGLVDTELVKRGARVARHT